MAIKDDLLMYKKLKTDLILLNQRFRGLRGSTLLAWIKEKKYPKYR